MQDWMEKARCREVDPDIFMPDDTRQEAVLHRYRHAKAICGRCEVIDACRDYAFTLASQGMIYGVWGGLSAPEIHRAVKASA